MTRALPSTPGVVTHDTPMPEINIWPLTHARTYRVKFLKLNGQYVPVRDLFRPSSPRPRIRPVPKRGRAPQAYVAECPYCAQALDGPHVPPLVGSDASVSLEGRTWGRWHGHLLTHAACAALAFPRSGAPDASCPAS